MSEFYEPWNTCPACAQNVPVADLCDGRRVRCHCGAWLRCVRFDNEYWDFVRFYPELGEIVDVSDVDY
jgi:hypothetical protein